jgi:hypothetical protein
MFDESTRVGGFTFDNEGDIDAQIAALSDLLRKKIAGSRNRGSEGAP